MTSSSELHIHSYEARKPWLLFVCAMAALIVCAGATYAQSASHAPGWVVITIGDYRTLHAKAYPPEREPEPPPVEATLTRVDYDLRIDGELAAGRASLTVDVLKDGWVRVPIPAGLLVREAKLDGKLVSLVPSAAGKAGSQLALAAGKIGVAAGYCFASCVDGRRREHLTALHSLGNHEGYSAASETRRGNQTQRRPPRG
jgi:hypothetical protein